MTVNIKDSEARDLAQTLACETGETMTLAAIQAVRERLERVQRSRRAASADELLAIGLRCAQDLRGARSKACGWTAEDPTRVEQGFLMLR